MNPKKENKKKTKLNAKIDENKKVEDISDLKELPATTFSPIADSKTLGDFLEQYDKNLIVYPEMQRNSVWSEKDQSELIESLIWGIPIPPIYFNTFHKDGLEYWEILDGRQRFTALVDFFRTNTVKINSHLPTGYENLKGYTYKLMKDANEPFAELFNDVPFPVVLMDNAPDQLKNEFFQKLNKGGKALTVGELAHSSLKPANEYMATLLNNSFYHDHVNTSNRYAEYVPLLKVLHFIVMSRQKDNSFIYHPKGRNTWQDRIASNTKDMQTDLDNLNSMDDEKIFDCLENEVMRVDNLVDDIFGAVEIQYPNNDLLTNMILALLILEDKGNSQCMSHDALKEAFMGLVGFWDKGHAPLLRNKMKTQMANITTDEEFLINECEKLKSKSKNVFAEVLENIRNNAYSSYL